MPLLSIIIPTKNRYLYLYHCLKSISDQYLDQDVEIILHDNSTDELTHEIKNIIDSNSKIKYHKVDGWLSASENFDRAIGLANGDYLTMIGDDDSVSKYLIDAVLFMQKNSVDALNTPFSHYLWPDTGSRVFKKGFSGVLNTKKFNSRILELNINTEFNKMLLAGGTRLVELPRMYYGIVKKDVVSKVKQTCDTYIPGPSPDMANAVSMSVFTNNIYYVNFPIFIAGNSNKSTAGLGAKGAHVGKIEDVAFLPKDCAQKWSELIPKFWSGPTIWAESAIKAMEACDKKKINDFNYLNLYANCMVFNSSWNHLTYSSINKYISENKRNPIVVYTAIYYYIAILWVERFKILSRNILKILKFKLTINNNSMAIENVYCATEVLNEILSRKQNPFRV